MKPVSDVRTDAVSQTLRELRALGAQAQPIVCGPWMSEIGFELLYWIPFLRWAIEAADLKPEQLVILSRGGCASWYADLTPNYLDVFDTFTTDQWRALNARRVIEQAASGSSDVRLGQYTAKQYARTPVEAEIVRLVGWGHAAVLHPALMYSLFRLYWRKRVADLYQRCARLTRLAVPAPVIDGPYVAVKFYSSKACPQSDASRAYVNRIVDALAESSTVVVLDSGTDYDEHGAFPIDHPDVIRVPLTPRTNLATQTAVIGNAQAFVGTYGGFAYLAPLLGVPTAAFYGTRNFREDHLLLAQHRFSRMRVRFDVMALDSGGNRVCQDWARRWVYAA